MENFSPAHQMLHQALSGSAEETERVMKFLAERNVKLVCDTPPEVAEAEPVDPLQ